ncbi:MAG: nuclear transport factor 2 family protein [Bacteroidia bacterium]|nr:nuclear transport factor 2 family protein [Bacteroidia bacterium]
MDNNGRLEKSSIEIEQLIMKKEKDALNSWAEGSVTGYIKHFDDEATYIDDIGAQNRIDGLTALRAYASKLDSIGMIPKHRFEVIDPKVQVYQDFAIITLQYHPFGLDGTPGTKWKATSVYKFKDNDWKVVHGHWSMLKTE